MKKYNKKINNGFVILFAVTLSAILLSISLGVMNVAFKELKFSTSAKASNDAFLAADTGAEYTLFMDKPQPSGIQNYPFDPNNDTSKKWSFIIPSLGSNNSNCAKVEITKTRNTVLGVNYTATSIISKGYNVGDASCDSTNPDRVEREILVDY